MRTGRKAQIDRLVPVSGDLEDLITQVAHSRGRPVHLVPADLGPDAPFSGAWVATERADYVAYPAGATAARKTSVVCHELAHMLLGHEPRPGAAAALALAASAAPALDPAVAARMLMRDAYGTGPEHDAELLGTHLAAALAQRQRQAARASDRLDDRLR